VAQPARVAYALTVVFSPGRATSIGLGGHEWVDAATGGGGWAVPPVLLGDRVRHLEGETSWTRRYGR
jgi:hypothetical protein